MGERKQLDHIENLAFSGGGGRALAYLPAIKEAQKYGLSLNNIRAMSGSSAGAIAALLCTLTDNVDELSDILMNMPAEKLKDFSFSNLLFFNSKMGLCDGDAMVQWLKDIIHKYTGLDNPTFEEFYKHTGKDLRVFVTNLTQGKLIQNSVNNTPHIRVAEAIQASSAIPFVFKPRTNHKGEHLVDGGLIKNYPLQCFDFYDGHGTRYANPATLGFVCKDNSRKLKNGTNTKIPPASNAQEYIKRVMDTAIAREASTLTPDDKSRTVMIDCPDSVNLLTFKANAQQKEDLEKAAGQAIDSYIDTYYSDHKPGYGHKPLLYSQAPIKVLPAGRQYDFDPRRPLQVSALVAK